MRQRAEPIQRRALKVTIVGVVSLVLGSVLSFVSVPVCLRAWGSDRYGAWLALIAGYTFVRTIDTGYMTYVGNEDQARMRRSLAASLRIGLGLGVIEAAVWAGLVCTGKLASVLGVGAADVQRYHLGAAFGVLVLASAATAPYLGVLHRLFIPAGMMYEASWFGVVNQSALVLGQVAAALLGASLLQAALLFVALQTANYIASTIYLRRKAPELSPWWNIRGIRTGIDDFAKSTLLTLSGIGQQLTTSGVVLFVSSVFGAAGVPLFTTVRTLANLWTMLSNVFTTPFLPEVVRFHGTKEHEKLFKAFRAHWFFSGLIVNISMIFVLPFFEQFYAIWTRRALQLDKGLFFCTMASVSLANFGSILNTYLAGINELGAQLVTTAVRAMIVFGLGFALVPWMGLRGLGVALLIAEGVCSVILGISFTNRVLKRFESRLPWRSIGLALLGTLPIQYLAVLSTVGQIQVASWIVAGATMTGILWISWRWLDPDVKSRALLILHT